MPNTDTFSSVGIIGLGLIGGSMAKAIRRFHPIDLFGMDRDHGVLETALQDGTLTGTLEDDSLASCRLLMIALYPEAAVVAFEALAHRLPKDCIVVDLCGVKRAVAMPMQKIAKEHGLSYIGAHPMAGMEKSGYRNSRGDLFSGASMILTPPPEVSAELLDRLKRFFLALGFGSICLSSPEHHDKVIALTSQLAHIISCAYIGSPTALEFSGFSAGSFRDMTRVARLNETMWTELFFENRDYLADETEGMAHRLSEYAALLRQGDHEEMFHLLQNARLRKEEVDQILQPTKGGCQ